ncbi:transposase [Hymenobacter rigui]|uniref:transposase n=1 Tax=Hymenobacter rigui TaxID=334424 RepID=UPI0014777CB3|nr:transposase [Hymenobacter rigui]
MPQALGTVVTDRAYDTNAVVAAVAACEATPVIPFRTLCKLPRHHAPQPVRRPQHRNKAERFFGHLKEARGFTTRYEKTASSFLALAHLLAALDWMR